MGYQNFNTQIANLKTRKKGEDLGFLITVDEDVSHFTFHAYLKNINSPHAVEYTFTLNYDYSDTSNCKIIGAISDTVSSTMPAKTYRWEFWAQDSTGFDVCIYKGNQVIES